MLMFYKETNFRETPIGKIPEDWDVIKFGDVCRFKRGFSYRSNQITKDPTKTKFITINDFEKEGGLKRDAEKIYIKEDVNVDPGFFLDDGDVLIANTDMSKGFIIGAPILIEDMNGKLVYSMDLTKLIFSRSKISSKFLFYYLTYEPVRQKMKAFAQGTNVLHLNHNLVKNMRIPLPPLPEQKAIAHILSTVDEAIQKTNEIIAKTERLKKGLMQELLTKGVNIFALERDRILKCVRKCLESRDHEFEIEEDLNRHLAEYLKNEFPEYDVDVVIEKRELRPDIIVHKRRTDQNLFAIEVRKDWNVRGIEEDIRKLEKVMLSDHHYCEAIFIGFNIKDFDLVFKLSNKVNFVLVNPEGEIKVKAREREFKDTEIGRIPKEWKVVKLGNIITYKKGKKPATVFDKEEPDTLPYLTADNLRVGIFTQWAKEEDEVVKVDEDDLFLIWDGFYCGDSFIGFKGILSSTMIKIEPKQSNLNKRYLYYFLKTRFKVLNSQIAGMYLKHVSKFVFNSLKIPLAPSLEQQKIAEILSTVDKRLEVERKRKEKLERIKKALMDLLLTGKIRVKI